MTKLVQEITLTTNHLKIPTKFLIEIDQTTKGRYCCKIKDTKNIILMETKYPNNLIKDIDEIFNENIDLFFSPQVQTLLIEEGLI